MTHINDQIQAAKDDYTKNKKVTPQVLAALFASTWAPYGFPETETSQIVDGVITLDGPDDTPAARITFEVLSDAFDDATDS